MNNKQTVNRKMKRKYAMTFVIIAAVLASSLGWTAQAQTYNYSTTDNPAATLTQQSTSTPASLGITSSLYRGITNSEVATLQTWLKTLPSIYPEGLVTGYFGSLTEAAVKRYQASKGISAIGIVGPQTRMALNGQFLGTGGPSPVSMITKFLALGMSDPEVALLQNWLKTLPSIYPQGLVSGYFGSLTQSAVMRYQASKGILQTGAVGPLTRAALNAQFAGTVPPPGGGTPPPTATSSQLNISLSGTNPSGASVPRGSTGVRMLSFNANSVGTGQGIITDIVLRRDGVGLTSDISSVYLYSGNTRLTTGRTVNSSTNNIEFHNLNIAVPSGQTLTIDAVVDFSTTASSGNTHRLQLISASSTISNMPVLGSFPISGNSFTIAGASAGTITIAGIGTGVNPRVGDQDVQLARFSLTAGSVEDLELRRITLYNSGTVNVSNFADLRLVSGGATVATASASPTDQNRIVFVLISPMNLNRGTTVNFDVIGDIVSGARAGDTIQLRLDESADLLAIGKTFGFGAQVTNNFSSGSALTIQGGQVTVSFNGPITQNYAPGMTGVELMNFVISVQNTTEFRSLSLRLDVATTSGSTTTSPALGSGSLSYFNNVRVLNSTTNQVVAGPRDAAVSGTSSTINFTDNFQVSAGQSQTFRVLADVSSVAPSMQVRATLLASSFAAGQVRNVENNTNITNIVPSTDIQGNYQRIINQALTITLAGTPGSQTVVRGAQNVNVAGFNFTSALGSSVTVDSMTVNFYSSTASTTASFSASSVASNRILDASLVDSQSGTQIGTVQSVGSNGVVQFNNLNYSIPSGTTKTLIVRADLTNNPLDSQGERIKADIASVTARDSLGNSVNVTVSSPNQGTANAGTIITIGGQGSMSVAQAPDDVDSRAGIVVAGTQNEILAKFRITASNEPLQITRSQFELASASAFRSVNSVTLWDGPTQIAGPVVMNSLGQAVFNNVNFSVPQNTSKVLTVKGNLNTIAAGAVSGDTLRIVYSTSSNFEAIGTNVGSNTQLTSYGSTAVSGNDMIVRKTEPTIALTGPSSNLLTSGTVPLARISVNANSNEQLSVKKMTFSVGVSNATLSANSLQLYDITTGQLLTTTSSIASSGGTGEITLTPESIIPAGGTKVFELRAVVTSIGSGSASISTTMQGDSALATGSLSNSNSPNTGIGGTEYNFIWSDFSVVGHTESSADYTNGRNIRDFSNTVVVSK